MRNLRRCRPGDPRAHLGDLEGRLADLREAMYQSAYARNDPARQRRFLAGLFEGTRKPDATFISIVEARDQDDEPWHGETTAGRHAARWRSSAFVITVAAAVLLLVTVCYFVVHREKAGDVAVGGTSPVKIRVGLLNVVDTAPFYRALDAGYFRDEKLDIEVVKVRGGPDAVKELAEGRIDIAFTSYPGALTAEARKVADLKIVAEAYTSRTGHLMLMGAPDGSFTHARQAPGKKVAVTGTGTISDIGTSLALRESGVDPATVTWVPMSMDDMLGALARGEVDGAVLAEPYVTRSEQGGAIPVLDVTLGSAARLPLSGWFVTDGFATAAPKVVQAFQRALVRGVTDVQNRDLRNAVLVKYLGVDPGYVDDVRIATYPAAVEAGEIQKVADLMHGNGFLAAPLDVRRMLLGWPGNG